MKYRFTIFNEKDEINISEAAKELRYPGVGRNNLVALLKYVGILNEDCSLNNDFHSTDGFLESGKKLPNREYQAVVLVNEVGLNRIKTYLESTLGLKPEEVHQYIKDCKEERLQERQRRYSSGV